MKNVKITHRQGRQAAAAPVLWRLTSASSYVLYAEATTDARCEHRDWFIMPRERYIEAWMVDCDYIAVSRCSMYGKHWTQCLHRRAATATLFGGNVGMRFKQTKNAASVACFVHFIVTIPFLWSLSHAKSHPQLDGVWISFLGGLMMSFGRLSFVNAKLY